MAESRTSGWLSSWFTRGRLRPSGQAAAMGVAAALAVTLGVVADPAQAAAAVPASSKPKAAKVASRPDLVSAQITARAQGSRVEVESLRNETSTTWVNPDGTLTTQQHQGPIRFKDAHGGWRDVDLEMADRPDGTAGPKGHVLGLSLAGDTKAADAAAKGAAETDAVAAHERPGKGKQARDVVFGWTGQLGTPVLSGTTATYKDVKPGVDLTVDARRTGFETHLVINTPAALASLVAAAGSAPVSWDMPVKTKGLTARAEKDGSVSFVDADGKVASRIVAPVAWDALVDEHSGNHVNESPVKMTVAQTGKGRALLTLTPDPAWLADPARKFPITVDPTYASGSMYTASDAYVSQANPTTNYAGSTQLWVGTTGADTYRSFLKFDFTNYKNLDVTSASLSLYEFYSGSCTPKPFYVYASGATDSGVTWNTQPGVGSQWGSLSVAKGFSSACTFGRVFVPITGLVDYWSNNAYTSGWLRLTAPETDTTAMKKFYSLQSASDPYLTFTYNRKPNAAAAPTIEAATTQSYYNEGIKATEILTSDSTPLLSSKATDPDASKVSVTFEIHTSTTTSSTTLAASCATGYGASGSLVSCSPTTALGDSKHYYVRAAVKDERGLWNGTWSPWTSFYTGFVSPPTPVVTCPAYANGTWTDAAPTSDVTCTVSAAGSNYSTAGWVDLTVDGVYKRVKVVPSYDPNVAKTSITIPKTVQGAHTIVAIAVSRPLKVSAPANYSFGWGDASLTYPVLGTASSGKIAVAAGGPPRGSASAVTGKIQWRVAGSGNETTGWTDGPAVPVTNMTGGSPGATDLVKVDASFALNTATQEAGSSTALNARVPTLLDIQVCFTYTGGATQCTWSQSPRSVTRVPHAFGNGYPTSDAGPGQVALFTGEFNTAATDVSVPGYSGDLSLSRSHSSFDGDGTVTGWPTDPVTGVFGPGWTASLQGADAGAAGMQVIDNTRQDGTIVLVDEEENALVYQTPTKIRAYKVTQSGATTAPYVPATADTAEAAADLTITNTGTALPTSSMVLTFTEEDGTITKWAPVTYSSTADTVWKPVSVQEPNQVGATTYGHDATGRVTRIVAPVPPNSATPAGPAVSCPLTGTLVKGCRALDITYATTTTATSSVPGDSAGRVKQVTSTLWDPEAGAGAGAMATTIVASYTYDTSGRMMKEMDPRTGLGTDYTWDGTSTRLASIKPSGLAAYRLSYDTTPSTPRVAALTRDNPTGSGTAVTMARYAYSIPLSGTGLPDLTSDATTDPVKVWGQASNPVTGYAVFGADYTGPISGTGVDWAAADLQYADSLGYTVNTATYGAGTWQVTATDYDTTGNVTRQLDAGATNTVLAQKAAGTPLDAAQVNALSTQTFYNQDITGTVDEDGAGPGGAVTKVVTPAGTLVTDTYGPTRNAALTTDLNADGVIDVLPVRPHVHTDYDQGAPTTANGAGINPATGEPFRLPTTITTGVAATTAIPGDADLETTFTTVNIYAKLSSTDTTEGDPWALGAPTKVTTGGITSTTRYDTEGRTTETRQPLSSGTDAGTTKTIYYTAGANTADAACGNKVEWAGLTCRTTPAAAPTAGAGGSTTLPDSRTTAYNAWLQPLTVVETSGTTTTRTTNTRYDTAGRTTATWTTTSGLTGSTARPGAYTHYRTTDGLVDYTGNLNATKTDADTTARTTTTYDQWGRTLSTTNDLGDTTTTTYVAPGNPGAGSSAAVTDPKGTTTFTYDGTDAEGNTERRGLLTGQTITRAGTAGTLNFSAAYDADGKLITQKLPGQVTQRTTYDEAGEPIALSYSGNVQPVKVQVDTNGDPVAGPNGDPVYVADGAALTDQPWLAWSVDNDAQGRVRTETTGPSAGFDSNPGVADPTDITPYDVGEAIAYDRSYSYDAAGRLTTVVDHTASDHAVDLAASPCAVRTYAFDLNGRRTTLTSAAHADGNCAGTAGVTTTTTSTNYYDTADRPTLGAGGTGQYVYDAMGRQTTLPSTDAPSPGNGNITLGYFDDDLPRSITQGTTGTTFTLDSAGRRQTATTTTGTSTSTLVRHYTDNSDNPAWTVATDPLGAATTTRYAESIGGDLGLTIAADASADLTLATLHGDVVTTVPIAATAATTAPAAGIDGWSDYQEYGAVRPGSSTPTVAGTIGYGWLGAKQRSTTAETAGLTLMGDRLYNATTGRFTTVDPEPGGNANAYTYPTDPINQYDLDGHWWSRKKWKSVLNGVGKYAGYASYIPGPIGMIAGGVSAAAYLGAGNYKSASLAAFGAVTAWAGGRAITGIARGIYASKYGRGAWHGASKATRYSRYLARHPRVRRYVPHWRVRSPKFRVHAAAWAYRGVGYSWAQSRMTR